MTYEPSGLSERRQAVLRAIILEHIATARPVASESVARSYDRAVSSATIRNEMAALESMGYVIQTHASAGRLPSELGYRFFVEHLMEESVVPYDERRMIAHQFHQTHLEIGQWLRLAASVLANNLQNASVVTAPRGHEVTFKHLELIQIQEMLALVVVVFESGSVHQQMFAPHEPTSQKDLSEAAVRLNVRLQPFQYHSPIDRIDDELDQQVMTIIERVTRELQDQVSADVFVDGLEQILSQPEFSAVSGLGRDSGPAMQVMQLMQQGLIFNEIVRQMSTDGLHIIIGGDGKRQEMRQVSLVISRYGTANLGGLVGVLGPTRMQYGRAISMVRFVGGILSDMTLEMSR